MGKLHELLAVEPDLKGQAERDLNAAISMFKDGQGRFIGQVRTYQPLDEEGETFAPEVSVLAALVKDELDRIAISFSGWLNASVQKEITNRETSASIEVDGTALLEDLPAPALLNLESKLALLRRAFAAIPTNDQSKDWSWDEDLEHFVSAPQTSYRTKKIPRTIVAYEATEHHPAQVQAFNEDIRVGEWTTIVKSGMVTPRQKRLYLARIDELARAVKQARHRANDVVATEVKVADAIIGFIFGE